MNSHNLDLEIFQLQFQNYDGFWHYLITYIPN